MKPHLLLEAVFALGLFACGGSPTAVSGAPRIPRCEAALDNCETSTPPLTSGDIGGIGALCRAGFINEPQTLYSCGGGTLCCQNIPDKPAWCEPPDPMTGGPAVCPDPYLAPDGG